MEGLSSQQGLSYQHGYAQALKDITEFIADSLRQPHAVPALLVLDMLTNWVQQRANQLVGTLG